MLLIGGGEVAGDGPAIRLLFSPLSTFPLPLFIFFSPSPLDWGAHAPGAPFSYAIAYDLLIWPCADGNNVCENAEYWII